MKGALYARVSTNGHGQAIDPQPWELRDYYQRLGRKIGGEFVDTGISGQRTRDQN